MGRIVKGNIRILLSILDAYFSIIKKLNNFRKRMLLINYLINY